MCVNIYLYIYTRELVTLKMKICVKCGSQKENFLREMGILIFNFKFVFFFFFLSLFCETFS